MRALEFQEKCKKENIKKFTMEYLPTNEKIKLEWVDVWLGCIQDPFSDDCFIPLRAIRKNLGNDNIHFTEGW